MTSRYTSLFFLDCSYLLKRLRDHSSGFITIYSSQGSRSQFEKLFSSFFQRSSLEHLRECSEEFCRLLFEFHKIKDDLHWYLLYSDDMPGEMEQKATYEISQMEKTHYEMEQLEEFT